MNISIVRPLVDRFWQTQDLSIVYCLLVNRTQFIRDQTYAAHHQTISLTRALLCEIIAEKILRRYNENNPGPKGLLKLANVLVAGFEPFQNAPDDVLKNNDHIIHYMRTQNGKNERKMTALEVAILSESKIFLASSACQKVIDAIYRGKLVYTPNSFMDILPDYWKKRPISLYDPRRGPVLNQYRLAVPRTRNVIEIMQFVILLILYLVVMSNRETRLTTDYTAIEFVFEVYAWGWILDQVASMLEHGWHVYTQNLWSFLDVIFSCLFTFYFFVRMHSLACDDPDDARQWARLALDILSCAAPVLIPRLAFNVFAENPVFLSLRDMLADFIVLVSLAVWCFAGFLLSLKWLHNGAHAPVTIGKWMIWIWFGLDGTGIDKSVDFHWLLGPTLIVMFAFLGNTLFVTILVSMLSNTFSNISARAVQEVQFRRAVLTFEGVKCDALFAYMPPFNLLALATMLPLKLTLTPRWFHKANVFVVKAINAPMLVAISLYERRTLWVSTRNKKSTPRDIDWGLAGGPGVRRTRLWSRITQFWELSRFSVYGDLQAVFDEAPTDEGIGKMVKEDFNRQFVTKKTKKTSFVDGKSGNLGDSKSGNFGSRLTRTKSFKEEFATDSEIEIGTRMSKNTKKRKDSIDLAQSNVDMVEANERIARLENSLKKIEGLLLQIVTPSEAGNGADGVEDEVEADVESNDDHDK
ncbi:hypothetical protein LTR66_014905 [Elasticomyces elasticus]|nr:hypothetical protein LTR66_014905 [Elasticomyces elasticus]